MNGKKMWISVAATLLAALSLTLQLTAQDNPDHKPKHHQYKLYDVGTFGGPNSYGSSQAISLTSAGGVGASDLPIPDPFFPFASLTASFRTLSCGKGVL